MSIFLVIIHEPALIYVSKPLRIIFPIDTGLVKKCRNSKTEEFPPLPDAKFGASTPSAGF
ncbi:MAG: hypothetical protein CVV49_09715 [Spirochaetae bacterium HGW-Spirochaetae-5]|nr:MAG: hypothetical protein CVV49_09715 [Spirochaetae bacterium HGW-Spirochaetae-5]